MGIHPRLRVMEFLRIRSVRPAYQPDNLKYREMTNSKCDDQCQLFGFEDCRYWVFILTSPGGWQFVRPLRLTWI